jgi:hypothetical protein
MLNQKKYLSDYNMAMAIVEGLLGYEILVDELSNRNGFSFLLFSRLDEFAFTKLATIEQACLGILLPWISERIKLEFPRKPHCLLLRQLISTPL